MIVSALLAVHLGMPQTGTCSGPYADPRAFVAALTAATLNTIDSFKAARSTACENGWIELRRFEYLRGKAEDWGRVVAVNQSVSVPFGNLTGCIRTDDWSGLEGGTEQKYYCPTVGTVLEVESASKRSQLTTVTKQ